VNWIERSAALDTRVAELRESGMSAIDVSEATRDERKAVLNARSAAFAHATQGSGKPLSKMRHGDGVKPEPKKGKKK
jgi:hypothetical protein